MKATVTLVVERKELVKIATQLTALALPGNSGKLPAIDSITVEFDDDEDERT